MNHKLIVWLYLAALSIGTIVNLYAPQIEAAGKEEIVIPGEAIRLRILANSDREADQELKRKVRDEVNAKITEWVGDLTSLDEAREAIKGHLPEIEAIAKKIIDENGSDQNASVEFGIVNFPTKLYGQFLYPAGEYEAILITLGEGKGANWWCVLYPPLCFLDFSSGTAVRSPGFEDGRSEAGIKEKVETSGTGYPDNVKETGGKEAVMSSKTIGEYSTEKVLPKENNSLRNEQTAQKDELPVTNVTVEDNRNQYTKKVYVSEDEQPVQVKFFVVELWEKLMN
ncbi:stage II sporulation protein R [Neobacillus piezotolerans]|uniref:Stage II sporulation protein R n=1 Tax=Neobacillus piezotolerans TaxID=2259171 RepID=A0A3D8GSN8_9BACI|nr:stage II sporulation protein R [Neobacillus piezotolerans]RDU37480.1 stage II sporulation protein R [Neobacillus piezotolerans]